MEEKRKEERRRDVDIPVFVVLLGVVRDLLQALATCVIGSWMDSQGKRGDFVMC